jgi:hypothetical protein
MPNSPHNVSLRIAASDQYSFSGGSEGSGNCRNAVGQGAAPVQITLEAPTGYRIRAMSDSPPGVQLTGADEVLRVGPGSIGEHCEYLRGPGGRGLHGQRGDSGRRQHPLPSENRKHVIPHLGAGGQGHQA